MHLNWLCHRSNREGERERAKEREDIQLARREREQVRARVLMIIEFDNNSMFIRVTSLDERKKTRLIDRYDLSPMLLEMSINSDSSPRDLSGPTALINLCHRRGRELPDLLVYDHALVWYLPADKRERGIDGVH